MKKILLKSFSLFMALIMMLGTMPLLVSATDVEAPAFAVKTISETKTELQLAISLTKGSFVCFDCTLTVNGLECQSIVTTDTYDQFAKALEKSGNGAGVQCGNAANGKFSLSTTGSCSAPMDIVIYTFIKESATGINGTDISFTVDSCYVDVDGIQTDYTAVTSSEITLPDTHQHTAGEWTAVTNATCNAKGSEARYCTACGTLVESRETDMTEHKNTRHDIKAATCIENGYDDTYCDDCHNRIDHKVLTKTGHSWTSWSTVKEPTYRSVGYERRYCTTPDCGAYEDREIPMISVTATGLKISMESLTMNYKQSATIYADVMPEEAAFSSKIVWTSSNPRVVTVDENGLITATGKGHAVVTASTEDEKFSSSCDVTVQYNWIQFIIVYILFGWIWYLN